MSINLEYYKVFNTVAKYKKISLAAEKLFVSQPAVTQTIQKLEEQLGNTLFVRTKAGMELTDAGKMLYDFTKENIETLNNVEYRFSKYESLEDGIIRIRTGSNVAKLILYDALEKFSKEYPNVKIEIATGAPNQAVKMMHTGECQFRARFGRRFWRWASVHHPYRIRGTFLRRRRAEILKRCAGCKACVKMACKDAAPRTKIFMRTRKPCYSSHMACICLIHFPGLETRPYGASDSRAPENKAYLGHMEE